MKLYFAGPDTSKFTAELPEVKYILESYFILRNGNLTEWLKRKNYGSKKLFLDSGAFSAYTQNKQINIQQYCEYIKKYEKDIELYAGLDVIGDCVATRKNIEFMENQGLKPLPTFHYKSPLEELHRLSEKYDYIALGGLVPLALHRTKLRLWLDTCFCIIKDNCKIHGFGLNAFWAWNRYPFYSVDATSWVAGGKFRQIVKFEGNKLATYRKRAGNPSINRLKCCITHYDLLNKENILAYAQAANYVTELWRKRGISWK